MTAISLFRRALAGAIALAPVALLTACASGGMSSGTASSSRLFELRVATTVPTAGWIRSDNAGVPGAVVYLSPQPILGAGDVTRATAQKNAAGQAVLVMQFSPAGTARLTAATRELVGRQLAALVEGRVTNMATVQAPMTINTMALTGFPSLEEAARVAHGLSAGK